AIIYGNGSPVLTTTVKHNNHNVEVQIGGGGGPGGQLQSFGGNIAQVSIYNRALSAAEIQQNFNATKGRVGL
ncbi:MAG: LamG-like jellyroll fold domain-containing protein, partial [Minisyncoccia bacterium]